MTFSKLKGVTIWSYLFCFFNYIFLIIDSITDIPLYSPPPSPPGLHYRIAHVHSWLMTLTSKISSCQYDSTLVYFSSSLLLSASLRPIPYPFWIIISSCYIFCLILTISLSSFNTWAILIFFQFLLLAMLPPITCLLFILSSLAGTGFLSSLYG